MRAGEKMEIFNVVLTSLYVSLTATLVASIISILIGIPFSIKQFRFKRIVLRITDTLMSIPPVLMGLLVFLLLSKKGPLGQYNLLFTPFAMILAQILLVLPIIFNLIVRQIDKKAEAIQKTCYMLGGSHFDALFLIVKECKNEIITSITTGFSRAISEVGAVMMVGGNIKGYTRVMTTYIAIETNRGNFRGSIIMGIILLLVSFMINLFLNALKGRGTNEYIY
ncbi:MAG: tungstate transport system permease protein [Thermoanaerobacterium sp.]|jgi:tungstate transport system permease protein|nr:tungstate transport system permease protein [Thermoanaerobacterium sp.]